MMGWKTKASVIRGALVSWFPTLRKLVVMEMEDIFRAVLPASLFAKRTIVRVETMCATALHSASLPPSPQHDFFDTHDNFSA